MNRLDQVNMPRTNRRFGLPQVALLTGAFATAVLLAVIFRPARNATVELASTISVPTPPAVTASPQTERETAQDKLAAAMARFANAPTKEAEPAAPAAPPAVVALAPPPAPIAPPAPTPTPAPVLEVVAPVAAPAPAAPPPALALRPTLPPMTDADLRRLGDKAAQAIRDGDIYGARLILERAIEGGDASALFALAETYDPRGLARMNVKSVKPDLARARALYSQALDKGVTAARAKLEGLDR